MVCQGDDGLHYYGRVEGIYELNYGFDKGLNPVVFKCHWFDPRRVRRDPEIGLVEVERSSVYKGEDVYILATGPGLPSILSPVRVQKPGKTSTRMGCCDDGTFTQ